jgi:hypothetical protein
VKANLDGSPKLLIGVPSFVLHYSIWAMMHQGELREKNL